MSDNVNKDIQDAVKAAQGSGKTNSSTSSANIPSPRILQHSLEKSGGYVPTPIKLQEGKEKK